MCWGGKAGPTRLRGGGGGKKGQCTWSQPSSFPSPLPGSPRLPTTPWFPRPPHPCAQPLQKQLLQALATPRLVLLRWPRMLLPQMAGPRRAGLPLCLLELLLAAMTAPRAAGRGVRVRERAGWRWGGRAGAQAEAAWRGRAGGPGNPELSRGAERALPGGATLAGARLGSALLR